MVDDGVIICTLPAPILSESNRYVFAYIQQNIYSRLTSSSHSTSSDPRYIAFSYDMLINLSVNHQDTRMLLNRGLTASSDKSGGLGLRTKNDSVLLESIDSKQMMKNLSVAQKFIKNDFFIALTCNKRNTLEPPLSKTGLIQVDGRIVTLGLKT